LLLRRILDAYDGKLPDGGHVLFANTGREHPATLDFVHRVEAEWCPITWVEYQPEDPRFRVVSYETASRNGEPFSALIAKRNYLPNPIARFCTSDLKVKPMQAFMRSMGLSEFTTVIGLRADEQRRVSKLRGDAERDLEMPLADAGIVASDVLSYWAGSPFDLCLPDNDPAFGNCDLCFLKGRGRIERVLTAQPKLGDWWIEQEAKIGSSFRSDRPTYAQMRVQVTIQGQLFQSVDDTTIPCECTE
jgi:hypothetical protein